MVILPSVTAVLTIFFIHCLTIASFQSTYGFRRNLDSSEEIPLGAGTLAFVFDVTGSMYDDLQQVIEGAAKILNTLLARQQKPIYNYVLVPFHDPDIGPVTVTTNPDIFQLQLKELYVQGGGDCPEMSVGAIKQALDVSLPSSSIYVFTDARAKDHYLLEDVLKLIQRKESQVVFVMTGDCGNHSHPGYQSYEKIASTSSGQIFHLKKSDVNEVLNFVRVSLQARKVNLLAIDRSLSQVTEVDFDVDSTLREFTVSVSGDTPEITLVDPSGRDVGLSEGLNNLLNLKNVSIVNIKDPFPGPWKLWVRTKGPHTIRSTGLSTLDFIHGFSRQPTAKLKETYHRPLKGAPTHLLINGTNLPESATFRRVEVVNLDGNIVEDLYLERLPGETALFNASTFIPPNNYFYLKTTGVDERGYPFQRITSTAINAQLPEIPEVSTRHRIVGLYGQTVVMKCYVQSLVPFVVQWFKEDIPVSVDQQFPQTAEITLAVPDVTLLSEGLFSCNASNIAGSASSTIYLDVVEPPPVIAKPNNISVTPGSVAVVTCDTSSLVDHNTTWDRLLDDGTRSGYLRSVPIEADSRVEQLDNDSLVIHRVVQDDEGWYRCIATNEGGLSRQDLYLIVQDPPKVSIVPASVNFTTGSKVNLTCVAEGYPAPFVEWRWNEAHDEDVQTGRIFVSRSSLIIQEAHQRDQGRYLCAARNPAGSDTKTVQVRYIEAPTISIPRKNLLVATGDMAELKCVVTGVPHPRVSWYHGPTQILPLSYIQISNDGTLTILGSEDSDAGEYTCVAKNEAGTTQDAVTLDVGSPPLIVQPPIDTNIDIEKNGSISCVATGHPKPETRWRKKGGASLTDDSKFTITPVGNLLIHHVGLEDEGTYVCTVENRLGVEEREADLHVTGIVAPVLAHVDPFVEVIRGKSLSVPCTLLHGNPRPTIQWLRTDQSVEGEDDIDVKTDGTLVIHEVKDHHEGNYTCQARNVGGNDSKTVSLNVQVPPRIVHGDTSDYVVVEGDPVVLPCNVQGDPRPIITWQTNGIPILPSHPHYHISVDDNLHILETVEQDTGTYVCTAANLAGVTNKVTSLLVQVPPRIYPSRELFEVIEGDRVVLPCKVRAVPPAQIRWKRSGSFWQPNRLDFAQLNNGSLQFVAQVTDAGEYFCEASNVVGKDTRKMVLSVLVPPSIVPLPFSNLTSLVNQTVSLPCLTSGYPKPIIHWQKNGINVTTDDGKLSINSEGVLLVNRAQLHHAGLYTCIAENPAGKANQKVYLSVFEPPRIDPATPKEVDVLEHSSHQLLCEASGYPSPNVSWMKDRRLVTGNELGLLLEANGTLRIDQARTADTGLYTCVASNIAGNDSADIKVNVLVPPSLDQTAIERDVEVVAGKTARLVCPARAIPPPLISWFREDLSVIDPSTNNHFRILNGGRVLEILETEENDAKKYTCVASNVAGETYSDFNLDVLVPPSIPNERLKNDIRVVERELLVLECQVTGNPTPKIAWMKDGELVSPLTTPGVNILLNGRQLQINRTRVFDAGSYKCIASNVAGRGEQEFSVNVLVPPSLEGPETDYKEVVISQRTVLECLVTGLPTPKISWKKNGTIFEPPPYMNPQNRRGDIVSDVQLMDSGQRILINHAGNDDAGQYTCEARNIAGEVSKDINLDVLVPPRIQAQETVENAKVKEGNSIVLECEASGHPNPVITWMKNGQLLSSLSSPDTTILPNGSLLIDKVAVRDGGQYTCMAANKAGSAEKDVNLKVLVPPQLEETSQTEKGADTLNKEEVLENLPFSLVCPVSGTPPPHIIWLKDGRVVSAETHPGLSFFDNRRKLQIDHAQKEDAGEYVCVARNEVGEIRKKFDLDVLVPPSIKDPSATINPRVKENDTLVLECPVEGNPKPDVMWLKDSQLVSPVTHPNFHLSKNNTFLTVPRIQAHHEGGYTCIATNIAGSTEREFSVDVLVPPKLESPDTSLDFEPKVHLNRPVTLRCPVTGSPLPQIRWFKNGRPLNDSSDSNVYILSGGLQLSILRARENDTGKYSCVALNEAGNTQLDFNLDVYVPPRIESTNRDTRYTITEKDPVIINCPTQGNPPPTITWLKDGDFLTSDQLSRIEILDKGQKLKITAAEVTDTGKYTCVAGNEAGVTEKDFKVDVQVPPKFGKEVLDENPSVILNRPVTIHCPVTGVPPPAIKWLKNGAQIGRYSDPNVVFSADGRQLKIFRTKVTDAGRYKCVAVNNAGRTEKDFNLNVQVPPKITRQSENLVRGPIVKEERVKAVLNGSVKLECRVIGNPEPTILWLKDGQLLTATEKYGQYQVEHNGQLLRITRVQVSDAGLYTCVASNVAGTSEKDFKVDVLVPPKIKGDEQESPEVLVNRPLSIDCPVDSHPPSSFTWIKNGVPVDLTNNPFIRLLDGGRRLQLLRTQSYDKGLYTCIAENEVGSAEKHFNLDVHEPPAIQSSSPNPLSVKGDWVHLECNVSGNPTPQVSWLKDGQVLTAQDLKNLDIQIERNAQVLRIEKAEETHKGKYTCIATNKAGSIDKNFNLNILVPPTISNTTDPSQSILVNRPLFLECPVQADPPAQIEWLKNEQPVDPIRDPFIHFINGGQKLQLLRTRVEDTGNYTCVATNAAGQAKKDFRLDVLVPPKIENNNVLTKEPHAVEKTDVELECYVSGTPRPTVVWMKDGKILQTDNAPQVQFLHENQLLKITEVEVSDGGRYTCVASSLSGTQEKHFDLTVQVPPKISNQLDTKPVGNLNHHAVLFCETTGDPRPLITWLKNGQPIDPFNEPNMNILRDGSELHIRRLRTGDAAKYTCVATNTVGQDEKHFDLSVHVPPTIDRSNFVPTPIALSNRTITLECPVSGNPRPTVTWLRDGRPLSALNMSSRHQIIFEGEKLRISPVHLEDAGRYKCITSNLAGNDEAEFIMDVLVPPRLDKRQVIPEARVKKGEDLVVRCPVENSQSVSSITWLKNGEILSRNDLPLNVDISPDQQSLKIMKAQTSDAGLYTCVAGNLAGETEHETEVDVLVPSLILNADRTTTPNVIEHQAVTLECEVDGKPIPTITWLRDGQLISPVEHPNLKVLPGNVKLRVINATAEDAGLYTCLAANEVGVAEKHFNLDVLVPPSINVSATDPNHVAVQNDDVVLECPASGNPTPRMIWYKDSQMVLPGPGVHLSADGMKLTISRVSVTDAGNYICMAVNDAGDIEVETRLSVMVPPVIDKVGIEGSSQVVINQTAKIFCEAHGTPTPEITWLKNGQPLSAVNSGAYRVSNQGQLLEILRVQGTDNATYSCVAGNDAGIAEEEVKLNVLVPPGIEKSSTNEEMETIIGQPVRITCTVTGHPPPEVTWLKNGHLVQPSQHIQFLEKGHVLLLNSPIETDTAEYTCIATNEAGTTEENFKLNVLIPPFFSDDSHPHVPVIINRPVRLDCPAKGVPPPEISWFKDGEPVSSSDDVHVNKQQLHIYRSQLYHTGFYFCEAANQAGAVDRHFNVSVWVPPKIENSGIPTFMSTVSGHPTILECLTSGTPTPTVLWLKNGRSIQNNEKIQGSRHQLEIHVTTVSDAGTYSCIASNVAGNSSREYVLNVLVPPSIKDGPEKVRKIVGESIRLHCEAEGVPQPQVTWLKDEEPLPPVGLNYEVLSGEDLQFLNVRVHNAGNYTCVAQNEAGFAKRNIELDVMVPPSIIPEPSITKVLINQSVNLPCEVTGHPAPKLTWQMNNNILPLSPAHTVLDDGSLQLDEVTVEDSGVYTCTAYSEAGSAQVHRSLEVQVPPTILSDSPAEVIVIQGQDVTIDCRTEGTPTPRIVWERKTTPLDLLDSRLVVLPNKSLRLSLVQPSDMGTYICTAVNEAGTSVHSTNVVVQVPPTIEDNEREHITTQKGYQVTLRCRSSGFPPPHISWLHNGEKLVPKSSRIELQPTGDLVILQSQSEDSGHYVCVAKNSAGREHKDFDLEVMVPPTIVTHPQDKDVTLGEKFVLECEAVGVPTPSVFWLLNNTKLSNQPVSRDGRSVLTIHNAGKENEGNYTCVATSRAGERKARSAIRVRVAPVVLASPGPQAVRLADPIMLNCAVDGDPFPQIIWTKNGQHVEFNHRIQQMTNGSLVIYKSVSEDTGHYKCVASNEYGAAEGTAKLVVKSGPSFVVEPHDTIVDLGETLMMDCKATGEPQPDIKWEKAHSALTYDGHVTVLANNTLRIVAVQISDEDVYSCLATNSLGSAFKDVHVLVRVQGMWSPWEKWGPCSTTCGEGMQERERVCGNPPPQNGGKGCIGPDKEIRMCELKPCPVDGSWSNWKEWGDCSTTCGEGVRTRKRLCENPLPLYGGKDCVGSDVEEETCLVKKCPVNGMWNQWLAWNPCSLTCGNGVRTRTRICDSPAPAHDGLPCLGLENEEEICQQRECEIHGGWGDWNQWSRCSLSCGGGTRERKRFCDFPQPAHGGRYCGGSDTQTDYCNNEHCPAHGGWSAWSSWGECSASCNNGQRRRFRNCNNPAPTNGGRACFGPSQDTQTCNAHHCPVDGKWSSWSQWSVCSVTCGRGTRDRTRECNDPPAQHGGRVCAGDTTQVEECHHRACEEMPLRAAGHVIGALNNVDIGPSKLEANITRLGMHRTTMAKLQNVPDQVATWLRTLVPLLTPVYWTTAYEIGQAVNGFSLTDGFFRKETQVSFATGEVLHMTHVARGLDAEGVLLIDVVINGEVPVFAPDTQVEIDPYEEDYVQTGPGSLYGYSARTFKVNNYILPYAWNHTITYDEALGQMPFLVETLYATGLANHYDQNNQEMNYIVSSAIAKGNPSNKCPNGFILDQEGPYCRDDDECSRLQLCSHGCANTPGSYLCFCPDGFTLGPSGQTCKDLDECKMGLASCEYYQECENTIGSYRCLVKCEDGFRRTIAGVSCQDINECEENHQQCDQQCINLIGSYRCDCSRGYRLVGSGRCVDINECQQSNRPCSHNCINTPGSYLCACPQGFLLEDTGKCQDIDECVSQTYNCLPDQECKNTVGSYKCITLCPRGFVKSHNGTCVDTDECRIGSNQCHYSQVCTNTYGSYRCSCPRGYYSTGTGQPCQDYDECSKEGQCQHQCENTVGSYRCSCPQGYRVGANGQTCQDIDECAEHNIDCGPDMMCFNTRGKFECVETPCPPNYDRDPTTGFCRLECEKANIACPPNSKYAEVLAFKMVALPSGIQAYQDLVRLSAYDHSGVHLPNTIFTIIENETGIPFRIRLEEGRGVLYTLQALDSSQDYRMKVNAVSVDNEQQTVQYSTKFLIYISVSEFPY